MTPFDDLYGYESFGGTDFSTMFAMDFMWSFVLSALALWLVQYILQAVGLYTVAKRRGIRHPWLSWLPIGSDWLLGCISDQYQYVVKGRNRKKRVALLVLSLLVAALGGWLTVGSVQMVVEIAMQYQDVLEQNPMGLALGAVGLMGLLLVMWGISVAFQVVKLTALYNFYASCVPGDRAIYLLLSMFVSGSMPILVFASRKWDLGMPPRKAPIVKEEPRPAEEPLGNDPEV